MTLNRTGGSNLTEEEYEELQALRKAIHDHPASVHYNKMERFADLMVRSLDNNLEVPIQ